MKYFRLDLLTLLISLFIFSSCQQPDSIGLDVDPENKITGTLLDTVTVSATTVKEDTLISSDLSQQPFGRIKEAVFGETESDLALALSFPTDSTMIRFGNTPALDSAVLVLRYGSEFYGDTSGSSFKINVHQLSEKYTVGTTYYNAKQWGRGAAVVGTKTVNRFAIRDSLRVTQAKKGKADTLIKVPPQLRIPLDAEFIKSAFFNAGSDNFSTNAKFAAYLKGLYLTIDKDLSTGKGGIVFFNRDSSRLELYYRKQSGNQTDTTMIKFPVSASASTIRHNYAGTPVQTQLNNPGQQFPTVYAQPLGGVRTKIRFPFIKNLKALGDVAINKAELVIYVDPTANADFNPAPRLTLYRTDIAGQRQEIPDNDIGQNSGYGSAHALDVNSFGGFYDKANNRYVFNISTYIQSLIQGRLQQYDTYIAPILYGLPRSASRTQAPDPRSVDLYPSGTTAAASALGSGLSPGYRMKLNIIYTKPGQ